MKQIKQPESSVESFWDDKYKEFDASSINVDSFAVRGISPFAREVLKGLLGDFCDKEVLDLGCGNGFFSVYMAKRGAKVTSVDISQKAIHSTNQLAKLHGVESSIQTHYIDALELSSLEKEFDLIVGKYILHHIEPFNNFSLILKKILKKGGRGIFVENNSRNPILKVARSRLAGKYGIPKYGDNEEHPFEPREVEMLRQNVGPTKLYYPVFKFFKLLDVYILKKRKSLRFISCLLIKLDDFIYIAVPFLRKYSYLQLVEVTHEL